MIRFCTAVAISTLVAYPVNAQEFTQLEPPESPILFAVAQLIDDDSSSIRYDAMAPSIPVTEKVTQSYTVMVPYTEEVEQDGKKVKVTRQRPEVRTREVDVTRMHRFGNTTYKISDCKFEDTAGTELPLMETLERLKQGRPVVTIRPGNELNDYYMNLLRDDVIVVVCPEPKVKNNK